jgi:antitoxin component of MazEF toxin-antitoxin module
MTQYSKPIAFRRTGGSLAITIPFDFVREIGLVPGDAALFRREPDGLKLRIIRHSKLVELAEAQEQSRQNEIVAEEERLEARIRTLKEISESTLSRDEKIYEMRRAGIVAREIASEFRISDQRVYQIERSIKKSRALSELIEQEAENQLTQNGPVEEVATVADA